MINKNDPVRCVLANHGLVVDVDGSMNPCCQYNKRLPGHDHIKFTYFHHYQATIQRKMNEDAAAGTRHDRCSKCWEEEDLGWTTIRQHWNDFYGVDAVDHFDFENPLYHVELRFGNFCNLKCIMCNPRSSSSVAAEQEANQSKFKHLGLYNNINVSNEHWWESPEFEKFSERLLKDARWIHMTGGEPFIIPEVVSLLDKLLPKKDTVRISFNTNLTKVSEKLLSRLSQFKNLNLNISLEGVEEMNDYIRYPSKWEDIVSNIDLIKNKVPLAILAVQHVLQHTSVYALPELVNFYSKYNMRLFLTTVQGDEFLTFKSVPPSDLLKFRVWAATCELLDNDCRNLIINSIDQTEFDPKLYTRYRSYVEMLDSIRGNDYYKIFKVAGTHR